MESCKNCETSSKENIKDCPECGVNNVVKGKVKPLLLIRKYKLTK